MATFGDMQARIADEINRADLSARISAAILSAIQRHERRRFAFNEKRATFTTVVGQAFYATTGNPPSSLIPSDILLVDTLSLTTTGGYSYTLVERAFAWMEDVDSNPGYKGLPRDWCWYAAQIRLLPLPNAAYPVTISYVQRLAALSAATDSNAWTNDAEALIRAAAKRDLYTGTLGDLEMAQAMRAQEADELAALQAEATMRLGTGRVTATDF